MRQSSAQSSAGEEGLKQHVDSVHVLIERCLQLYMTKAEIVQHLTAEARVDPKLVAIVFRKLEAENPEFFKAYNTLLHLQSYIKTFNSLLEDQARLLGITIPPPPPTPTRCVPEQDQFTETFQDPSCNGLHPSEHEVPMFTYGQTPEMENQQTMDTTGDENAFSHSNLPKIMSISDFADIGQQPGGFPRSLSLSNFTMEDFGGVLGDFMNDTDGYLQTPERDGFDDQDYIQG